MKSRPPFSFIRTCRKDNRNLQPLRYSLPNLHRPAVGLHDLPHQFEAQAVLAALGAGDVRIPVQRLQPGGIHPNAIVCHRAGASPILRSYRNGDMTSTGIVNDAVAD